MKSKLFAGFILLFSIMVILGLYQGHDYGGTDGVVNGIANEYAEAVGAGERDPYINTDQGDLLLFLFALAGTGVGFYLGYQWRNIMDKKEPKHESSTQCKFEKV